MKERRRYRRIRRPFIAHLRVRPYNTSKTPAEYEVVSLRDISAAGLLFVYNRELEINTVIEFSIKLPTLPAPLYCAGRVVRIDMRRREPLYHIAVSFIESTDEEREILDKAIKELDK